MNADLSESSDWMAVGLPADRLETVEIRLADETVHRAVWTGAQWWSMGQEVLPVAWRPLRDTNVVIDALSQSA